MSCENLAAVLVTNIMLPRFTTRTRASLMASQPAVVDQNINKVVTPQCNVEHSQRLQLPLHPSLLSPKLPEMPSALMLSGLQAAVHCGRTAFVSHPQPDAQSVYTSIGADLCLLAWAQCSDMLSQSCSIHSMSCQFRYLSAHRSLAGLQGMHIQT